MYASDSGHPKKNDGRIIRFDADGTGEVWHPGPFNFANGIALSPADDALFVVCSFLPGVERIGIRDDGTAGARTTVVEMPRTVPDGIAFDDEGRLYIACYAPGRIYRLNHEGELETFIDDWEAHTLANPTNIAFGGPDFDQLFVANLGRWHITQIDAGVKGASLACHKN